MWEIALKAPEGDRIIYFSDENISEGWHSIDNINDWVKNIFSRHKWTDKIIYNDDTPKDEAVSNYAHAKGVLVWNEDTIGWLIHSSPNWPKWNNGKLSKLPETATIYGQSFIFVELPITFLESIIGNLKLMRINTYELSDKKLWNSVNIPDNDFNRIELFDNIWHIAKTKKWDKDLFDDSLVSLFGGNILAETWQRPKSLDTVNVDNIEKIKWEDGTTYNITQDHSKYALSTNEETPWVYIGDINHTESQSHRGGGGIIIKDELVWKQFYSLVHKR
jgi:deoxyribonuclease-2